jgi:hypothetical protein
VWWEEDEFPTEMCVGPAGIRFVQVFDFAKQARRAPDALGVSRFPAGTERLVMIEHRRGPIFNRDHPLVAHVDTTKRMEWTKRIHERAPLDEQIARLAEHLEEVSSWFCALVFPRPSFPFDNRPPHASDYWAALVERSPEMAARVFESAAAPRLHIFDQSASRDDPTIWTYTATGSESRTVASIMSIDGIWRLDPTDQLEKE